MMRPIAASLLALAAAAHASAPKNEDALEVEVTLQPGNVHEACTKLGKGEKRRYHWKASAPVDFNIHYHEGPEVFYPVKRDGMRGDGGSFNPKIPQDYCWMWTAKNAPAKVTGKIEP
jgi:hypothetical protein